MILCDTCAPRGRCDNPQACMAPEPGCAHIHTETDMTLTTEELRDVLDKATPGPWAVKYNRRCTFLQTPEGDTMCDETYYPWVPDNDKDWHLIAAAPDLAAEVLALRAEVERLRPWARLGVDVMEDWPDNFGGLDGFQLHDMAVAAGVLQEVPGGYDPEQHIDSEGVTPEPGDPWFEIIGLPRAALGETP